MPNVLDLPSVLLDGLRVLDAEMQAFEASLI